MSWKTAAGVAGLGFGAMLVASAPAVAQIPTGTYVGTIQCDALPGMRALRTKATMTVADGHARIERQIFTSTGAPSGNFERGEGIVDPAGETRVTTSAATPEYSYEAEYKGQLTERTGRLMGTQRWKMRRETGTILRPCTIELTRAAQ